MRNSLFYIPADPWVEQLRHFARVVGDEEQPLITVRDAAQTLAAALAVGQSAKTGMPVAVADMFR